MSFDTFDFDAPIRRGIADLGFQRPTPIQQAALPPALAGRDVLACAMTGSGKTAAFALPLIQRLARGQNGRSGATRALVLTPTRELAAQVEEHLAGLGRHTRVRSAAVFGGVNARPQERALRSGVDVVVATPGRLLDHMGSGHARFDGLEVLVLDEADRMLDMGFLPDVRRILAALPRKRQTLFFSATMPKPIVALSREMLTDPVRLDVERPAAPASGVDQQILPVPQRLKPHLLLEMLRRGEVATALVFTRTKHRANRLFEFLAAGGVAVDRIHGNRSQKQREAALADFKAGKLSVLVATDIAARGIDVEALPHVINFDVPVQPDDYIHRVGRTARASATGDALTFAAPEERAELAAIERAVGRAIPRRRLAGFDYDAQPAGRFEIPVGERIAAIRARKAEDRARARAKAERKAAGDRQGSTSRRQTGDEHDRPPRGRRPPARGAETSGRPAAAFEPGRPSAARRQAARGTAATRPGAGAEGGGRSRGARRRRPQGR